MKVIPERLPTTVCLLLLRSTFLMIKYWTGNKNYFGIMNTIAILII